MSTKRLIKGFLVWSAATFLASWLVLWAGLKIPLWAGLPLGIVAFSGWLVLTLWILSKLANELLFQEEADLVRRMCERRTKAKPNQSNPRS